MPEAESGLACQHGWRCKRSLAPKNAQRAHSALYACFPATSTLRGEEAKLVETTDAGTAAAATVQQGFAILQQALSPHAAGEVLQACKQIDLEVGQKDVERTGNRERGRYSFSAVTVTQNLFHMEAWTKHLLDNPRVLDVLDIIYGAPGTDARPSYVPITAGGDYCLGDVSYFQWLHSDWTSATVGALREQDGGEAWDPQHCRCIPPLLCINFCLQPLTRWNGAMRIVPWADMRRHWSNFAPTFEEEVHEWPSWLLAKVFPANVGDALIRDVRVWHGGTPNLSGEVRFLPSIMVMSRRMFDWAGYRSVPLIPDVLYCSLSQRTQRLCLEMWAANPADEVNSHVNDAWLSGSVTLQPSEVTSYPFKEWSLLDNRGFRQAVASAHQLELHTGHIVDASSFFQLGSHGFRLMRSGKKGQRRHGGLLRLARQFYQCVRRRKRTSDEL